MEIHVDRSTVTIRSNGSILYSNTVHNTLDSIRNMDAILMHYLEAKCLWLETLHDVKSLEGDEKLSAEQKCVREIEVATKQIAIHRFLYEHKNAIIVAHLTRF